MDADLHIDFESEFVALHPSLKSYLFRLCANVQDAEDLAHETYLRAKKGLSGFAGQSSLKTWLFSIATNLARDHFRAKERWHENITDQCKVATRAAPEKVQRMIDIVEESDAEKYEFKEHIEFCFTCMAKTLPIEHQIALILREIYGFKVKEITAILGLTIGQTKHAIADARSTMIAIYDRRCTLVSKKGACYECSEIQGFVNPAQIEQEKRLKMVQEAATGADPTDLFELRTQLVRSVDPLHVTGSTLHAYLLGLMPLHIETDGD